MKQELTTQHCSNSIRINRYAYALYIVLFILLLFKGSYEWALINLGTALIFEPFDAQVKWQHRPFYQKAWLLVHVAIMFAVLIYMCFQHQ